MNILVVAPTEEKRSHNIEVGDGGVIFVHGLALTFMETGIMLIATGDGDVFFEGMISDLLKMSGRGREILAELAPGQVAAKSSHLH